MIILDTNVVSALTRDTPEPRVVAWLDRQPRTSVWITAVTVLEFRFGLDLMPEGHRASALRDRFDRMLAEVLARRVAPFDEAAATATGSLMAARQRRGQSQELRDSMIAGIALTRRAVIATRNVRHFADLGPTLIDPWAAA
ncbi:MAG: type II toxin-antitoxin system VapC family toxin [Methylobacteriaceae bacterium]|nr:type II toxin-antitoxin system VapC family toxin [Methylobacteriaceae bacterium]